MTTSSMRVAWAGAGLTLALTVGSPAIADDTELLVTNQGSAAQKPNILFILDSSGSMDTVETTQEPYNSSFPYPGSCQSDQYYWTRSSNVPACDSGNDNHFDQNKFLCQQGSLQITTAGSYTNTMAQYRQGRSGWKWRRLRSGTNEFVECADDSGVHGAGNPAEVYARIGTDNPPFTSSPAEEVVWGSRPTDRLYTVYDPNYLNWYHNSPVTSMTRTEIVQSVTKNVMASINGVNVGFMQFNYDAGGPVVHAVKDLDANRTEAVAIVDALPSSGYTPLSETMYEAARYWRGMSAVYGDFDDTDPDALYTTMPMVYDNPTEFACAKNFVVLLTDGEPTRDTGVYDDVPKLPNFVTTMGRSSCTGGNVNGACLDDIAEYLSKEDINSSVPGDQFVTTYTIGFTVDLPLLRDTAVNSGGEYYLAEDVQSLTDALTDIVTNIFDRDVSFTAPAVSVNAFNRTQHLNDLYISVFRASTGVHWPGNLKKYTINDGIIQDSEGKPAVDKSTGFFDDAALSYWTPGPTPDGANVNAGGALSRLPSPDSRNVYTNIAGSDLSAAANHISRANISAFDLSHFGLIGAAGEPTLEQMIDWMRGVDVQNVDNDVTTNERRQMGDTLHSQPASIVYDENTIVVYAATNDGNLHAIDASTGQELWTFIPQELLPDQADLFYDETVTYKQYGIDGDIVPVVADTNDDGQIVAGTDFVYLVFGFRRGGENYYALDVSNHNAPKLMWIKNYSEFGQTWSSPVAARIDIPGSGQSGSHGGVLVVGGGYDTTHDQSSHPSTPDSVGAGIFMLDLETGNELWRAGRDGGADLQLSTMTRAIPSRIRVLDLSGDGFADRMYAADLGGQVWRFDVFSGSSASNLVTGGVIARLGAEGLGLPSPAETRRFFASPDVAMFVDHAHDRRYLSISIGSGYRAHPLDKTAEDRFYSLRDADVFNPLTQAEYDSYPIIYDSTLRDVSGQVNVTLAPGERGWKFTLPSGEKVLSDSATFDNSVYFVSFEPQAASSDPCQAGLSVNRLYRVSVVNGDPVVNTEELDPNDPYAADEARVTELEQGGIAPKPTFLFPSPLDPECTGEECSPPPIGCVGVECFDPGYPNNPVRTLWVQDGVQ